MYGRLLIKRFREGTGVICDLLKLYIEGSCMDVRGKKVSRCLST